MTGVSTYEYGHKTVIRQSASYKLSAFPELITTGNLVTYDIIQKSEIGIIFTFFTHKTRHIAVTFIRKGRTPRKTDLG